MTATRIVTHCLAVWNSYSGELRQEDKDLFDAHVNHYEETDEFVAALELIKLRLERDGLSPQESTQRAHQLITPYAEMWGANIPLLVRVE